MEYCHGKANRQDKTGGHRKGKYVEVFLTASRRTDADGNIIGCFFFLRTVEPDLKHTLEGHKQDTENFLKHKEFAYTQQEMRNPLSGMHFTHKLLETTPISEIQKQCLQTSNACERQITTIIQSMDPGRIEEGNMELNMEEFLLGNVIDAIMSQFTILLRKKGVQIFHEIPDEVKTLLLYGDQIRLQFILSDFLLCVIQHAPSPNGWVQIRISPGLRLIQDGYEYIHLQFRMTHPGQGLPFALIQDMIEGGDQRNTREGLRPNLSRKLLNTMNGHVRYLREQNKSSFLIDLELRSKKEDYRSCKKIK